jgi:hypothetical protein
MMNPQANTQRNAITQALMNIGNPPPARPPMPPMAAAQLPQQNAIGGPTGAMPAPPGTMPPGMPAPSPGGPTGSFQTPGTAPIGQTPVTPMASAPGAPSGAAQGSMPQQPQGQTGQGF